MHFKTLKMFVEQLIFIQKSLVLFPTEKASESLFYNPNSIHLPIDNYVIKHEREPYFAVYL